MEQWCFWGRSTAGKVACRTDQGQAEGLEEWSQQSSTEMALNLWHVGNLNSALCKGYSDSQLTTTALFSLGQEFCHLFPYKLYLLEKAVSSVVWVWSWQPRGAQRRVHLCPINTGVGAGEHSHLSKLIQQRVFRSEETDAKSILIAESCVLLHFKIWLLIS